MYKKINTIINITDSKEQFLTEVCFESEYYNVIFKRLYIKDIIIGDTYISIIMNDRRIIDLKIVPDLNISTRKVDLNLI